VFTFPADVTQGVIIELVKLGNEDVQSENIHTRPGCRSSVEFGCEAPLSEDLVG